MLPKIEDAKTLNLNQLRSQLIPTMRDALIQLNDGSDKISDAPIYKYRKDGQIESQIESIRDIETGNIVSTKEIRWTYYDDESIAPVDTITITETDSLGEETSRKQIKHYKDKKQPEII
jgi:hypothetical protein